MNEIIVGEDKEAVVITTTEVYEAVVPRYEITLPDHITMAMGLDENSHLNFIEENGRVYIEKA